MLPFYNIHYFLEKSSFISSVTDFQSCNSRSCKQGGLVSAPQKIKVKKSVTIQKEFHYFRQQYCFRIKHTTEKSMEYNLFLSFIIITIISMDLFCSSWVQKFFLFTLQNSATLVILHRLTDINKLDSREISLFCMHKSPAT